MLWYLVSPIESRDLTMASGPPMAENLTQRDSARLIHEAKEQVDLAALLQGRRTVIHLLAIHSAAILPHQLIPFNKRIYLPKFPNSEN